MGTRCDLDEKFDEYFHELEGFSLRCERFFSDIDADLPPAKKAERLRQWLRAAFIEGARVMAQDTLDTLGDYGTAVAGIDEVVYNRSQAYDAAQESLHVYFTQVLSKAEEQ